MDLVIVKRALGVVSLGLGLAAVAAPRPFAKFVGLTSDEETVAAFGAREIAAGDHVSRADPFGHHAASSTGVA